MNNSSFEGLGGPPRMLSNGKVSIHAGFDGFDGFD